ncbi:MAG: addiction module toxin, HicA family [Chloroflexi bacterium]|nr:MAG: addiction module toxin, HicA family [Chloroflexota bacterium]
MPKAAQVLAALKRDGWVQIRQRGSHRRVDSCRKANDYETSCRICLRFREPQLELPGSEPWDRGRRRYARRCRTEGRRSRCLQSRGRRRCRTGGSRSRLPERRNRSKLGTPPRPGANVGRPYGGL